MRSTRLAPLAFSFALSLSLGGCGGAEPPPRTASAAPPAPPPATTPIDLSPVPEPSTLVVSGRVTKLSTSLATVHGWTKLPMPQSEQVTELLTSEAVGSLVDLDLPIDFAVAVTGTGAKMKDLTAVSAAVKDAERAKASLAERYRLVPGDNGVLLIQGLGKPVAKGEDGEGEEGKSTEEGHDSARTCELAPAFGEAVTRIVCAWTPKALAELGPWLTRTAPRASSSADLHVDVRMKPLQPTIEEQKRLIGMILGSVLGGKLGLSSLRDLAVALGTDLADFATDLDGMSADVTLGDGGAQAAFTLRLSGSTSTLGRIATSHPDRTGPVPAAFWQLPGDTDFALFNRGIDEADLAKGRDLVLKVVGDMLGEQGVKEADRKAIVDGLGKLVSPAAAVYGSGIDVEAVRKATAAEKALTAKASQTEREEAKRQTIEALLGWRVLGLDEPSAKIAGGLKELSAALGKPSVAAAFREKLKDAIPPALRSAPVTRGVVLPAGAQHYVLELHTLDRKAMPPPRAVPGQPAPPVKKPAGPMKPLLVHIFVVPDGQRTWLGIGGDEATAAARLATAVGASGEKLSARADLGALKSGNVGSGGFFTPRGLPEGMQQASLLMSGSMWGAMEAYEETSQLPHQGLTPLVFTSTSQAGGPPAVTVSRLQVPRDAIEDVVAVVLKHGGL